ncbi:hypothetical protein ET495_14415 [Xylanimonas allomyrinae]|uniref:DUF4190 domain-containing protein n=1 Tax=Xylanimonas allomyrinae TaxID=2509459 RepID=A0A4P6ERS3_9MICO|nr:hypothetical protein [Xylanimonas allomyrinae]QAY64209.1 hypothetical protein ET495_14415 [Xylanimonas allomyrinae]
MSASADRREPLAVVALALAVTGVVTFLLVPMGVAIALVPTLCVLAVASSVVAVRRIGTAGGRGRGLATAGFLVGGACLVAFGTLLVMGVLTSAF